MTAAITPPLGHTVDQQGGWVRDLATSNASWTTRQTTVGDYLTRLTIFDPIERVVHSENIPNSVYQRQRIPLGRNPIKKRMLRDLLRGGTLPTVVTVKQDDDSVEIADGLQRTDVLAIGLQGLLALERHEQPERDVQNQLKEMDEQSQTPLPVEQFLNQPLNEQIWTNLRSDEKLRLFMVLNVGQQKVSPRHLLEVAQTDLRRSFEDWGIQILTEREEKEQPRGRARKDSPPVVKPGETHYRYDLLIDGLQAYVSGDPHVKTRQVLESEGVNDPLRARIGEVGSEACREDFQWACLQLNTLMRERYEGTKWALSAQTSDNFLVPLFAALGKARDTADTASTVRHHQQELLEVLQQDDNEDPLRLHTGEDSLESIQGTVRSNIGRRHRAIAFFAWRNFFLRGPSRPDHPMGWEDAAIGA